MEVEREIGNQEWKLCREAKWIGSAGWQYLTDHPERMTQQHWRPDAQCTTREQWLVLRRDSAEQFERCIELLEIGSGRRAAEEASDALIEKLHALDAEITTAPLRSLDDVKLFTFTATREGSDLAAYSSDVEALLRSIAAADAGPGAISSSLTWKFKDS